MRRDFCKRGAVSITGQYIAFLHFDPSFKSGAELTRVQECCTRDPAPLFPFALTLSFLLNPPAPLPPC
jgi:hypothetical protein